MRRLTNHKTATMIYPNRLFPVRRWLAVALLFSATCMVGMAEVVSREVSLPSALDTGDGVKWKTSEEHPFMGMPDEGAVHGSSARVVLQRGEKSWLEATVDGPGNFDFVLRSDDIEADSGDWEFEVDGIPLVIEEWGSLLHYLFLSGKGPHRVRIKVRYPAHSGSEKYAYVLDDVRWVPAKMIPLEDAVGLEGAGFLTGGKLKPAGYATLGRDGGGVIVLPPSRPAASLGMAIIGPCELSWDSEILRADFGNFSICTLQIDGVSSIPLGTHLWQRMRLTLPEGLHLVRWRNEDYWIDSSMQRIDTERSAAAGRFWKLSNMKISRGISPLADAVDAPDLFALESGDKGGKPIRIDGNIAWQTNKESTLTIVDPSSLAKLTVRMGNPAEAGWGWIQADERGNGNDFVSEKPGWSRQVVLLRHNGYLHWWFKQYDTWWNPEFSPPVIDRIDIERIPTLSVGAAMDGRVSPRTGGWTGRKDSTAKTAGDAAWSLISRPGQKNIAKSTVTGPATVSFWWKNTGSGKVRVNLDGAPVPLPESGETWSRGEFAVSAGNHVVKWVHAADVGTGFSTPGEAWLDALKVNDSAAMPHLEAAPVNPH
ncbi:MAG: hypothetical protein V4819_16535 [Verrucomicrobiota bacterium]